MPLTLNMVKEHHQEQIPNHCWEMTSPTSLFFSILALYMPLLVISRQLGPNPCTHRPDPHTLRPDQMTVLINGYSKQRIPLLHSIAATYAASASVSSVVILWCNPSTSTQTLENLSEALSFHSSSTGSAPITVVHSPSSSLNSRFYPREFIATRAVLICDDDIQPGPNTINFAFTIWQANPDKIIGLFARSHAYDLTNKAWIYTMENNKYSIILTKFMIIKQDYLLKYSCGGGEVYEKMRKIVDEKNNCEDILMNVVVADEINEGPILLGAGAEKGVRDWGDARNEGGVGVEVGVKGVGLSSRKGEHRKRRGECIQEFHRLLGRMPLRYSYGKVVNSVGEQGLCIKGGNLVFCDQQV